MTDEKRKQWAHEYYQKHKKELYEKNTIYRQNHREMVRKSINASRKRKAEKLRSEGILNPWSVIVHKMEPKYDSNYLIYDIELGEVVMKCTSIKSCADFFETMPRNLSKNISTGRKKRYNGKWYLIEREDKNEC